MRTNVWRATRASSRLRRLALALGLALLSVVGAGTAVSCFGTWTYHWRAFDIQVGMTPALVGQTRLVFAPLGEVRARTHATPVALRVGLRGISFDEMKRLVVKPPPRQTLERDFRTAARRSLGDFALRQIALGAFGALLVPLFFRVRRVRWWLAAALAGGTFIALVLGTTLLTFQPRAFQNPTYTGSLQQAQWIITLVEDAFNKSEALGSKLRNVASNLNVLYGRLNAMPNLSGDTDTIKILHVSDIHNNPAALGFVRDLAAKFGVQGVIDTGDLTDFGTPLETQLARGLGALAVPYLFVAGNHDSLATVRAVRANTNAVVLGENDPPVTIAGLSVIGAPDPSSRRAGAGGVDTSEADLKAAGDALHARTLRDSPDITCVHNPRQAEPLLGVARVVLCGHMHRASIDEDRGTVVCNAGTTGAAGARYFERVEGVPFSAAILHFSRPDAQTRPRLLFIDLVVLDGALNRYSISRRTFGGASDIPASSARP